MDKFAQPSARPLQRTTLASPAQEGAPKKTGARSSIFNVWTSDVHSPLGHYPRAGKLFLLVRAKLPELRASQSESWIADPFVLIDEKPLIGFAGEGDRNRACLPSYGLGCSDPVPSLGVLWGGWWGGWDQNLGGRGLVAWCERRSWAASGTGAQTGRRIGGGRDGALLWRKRADGSEFFHKNVHFIGHPGSRWVWLLSDAGAAALNHSRKGQWRAGPQVSGFGPVRVSGWARLISAGSGGCASRPAASSSIHGIRICRALCRACSRRREKDARLSAW